MRILVVEDDSVIRKSLVQGFTEAGHDAVAARDAEAGLKAAREDCPDLIVLDVMLPKRSGLDLLKTLRGDGVQIPVIMLTALGAVADRVAGLTGGADDYVVKPFAFSELLARVEAVSRRALHKPATTLSIGDMTLDLTTRRVVRDHRVVELTPTEFSILELLLRFAGQVVTRQMLCEHIWGFVWDGNTNVIEVHVNRLRQKLDDDETASCIQTVRGRGYAFRVAPQASPRPAAQG